MSKHNKNNKLQHTKSFGDVTINDFANAEVCKNRQKKSVGNVSTLIKQVECDKSWDEKDDFYQDFDLVREINEDGTYTVVLKKQTSSKKRKENVSPQDCDTGNVYPLDVWFLISEYIPPQDIGRFAGICKTSFAVVCTAKFWFNLYKRYYKSVPLLPKHLEPECMVRLYGLRASVIRALYFMYPPFVNKFKVITFTGKHPGTLVKRQCVLTSFEKQKKDWLYYFKFKENFSTALQHSHERKKANLIEMLEDVYANPDENCCILQVTCLNFIAIPCVDGLTLKSAMLTLSHGFRHHRLQLGFGSGVHYGSKSLDGSSSMSIILDPVVSVKVLDWWHPLYPYNYNINHLLNQE